MPFKVKVTNAEGEVVEGTLEDNNIPEGLLTQEAADALVDLRWTPRKTSLLKNYRASLVDDAEFLKESLGAQNIDIEALKAAAASGGDLSSEKLTELRKGWDSEFLTPALKDNDKLKGLLGGLRGKERNAAILTAARRLGVKEELLQAPSRGADPMIVASFSGKYTFDDESQQWLERNSERDGFEFSSNPEKYGSAHRGIDESFDMFVKGLDKSGQDLYLGKQRQTGPGFKEPRVGSVDVVLSEADALVTPLYEAAEAQAEKQGGRVITVPNE